MGFGDERAPQPSEAIQAAANALAHVLHPDMDTVPGGSHYVQQQLREQVAKNGAQILERLARDGLVDIEAIQQQYGGQ